MLLLFPALGEARFQARFSASVAEEYNDNVEFDVDDKKSDFVTILTPALTLLYTPPTSQVPTFNTRIALPAKFFARNSDLNSFGDNQSLNVGYVHRYSERLSFRVSDTFRRVGQTRTGESDEEFTDLGIGDPDLVSTGDTLTNYFRLGGTYRVQPEVSVNAELQSYYSNFLDEGGDTFTNSATLRGNWNTRHRLPWARPGRLSVRVGGRLTYIRSRNGETDFIPSFDIGVQHLSDIKINLTPTLILTGNFGLDFNTTSARSIPAVVPTVNLRLQKTWERAQFVIGTRHGITNSLGVSGPSVTTDVFSYFDIRLTEKLTGFSSINVPFFRTEDVNFSTLSTQTGLRYLITHWLSSSLVYRYRFRNSGSGANRTSLREEGKVSQNSVTLSLTASFDIYPNFGLAQSPGYAGGGLFR